jgi:hypothetical protein
MKTFGYSSHQRCVSELRGSTYTCAFDRRGRQLLNDIKVCSRSIAIEEELLSESRSNSTMSDWIVSLETRAEQLDAFNDGMEIQYLRVWVANMKGLGSYKSTGTPTLPRYHQHANDRG